MALTLDTVQRTNQAGGQDFAVFSDGSQRHQSFVAADADGNPIAYGSNASSTAAQDSLVVKAAAGQVGEVQVIQNGYSGAAVCAMVMNATSLPANGTDCLWRIPIIGGVGTYWWPTGLQCSTGIVIAFSTSLVDLQVTTGSDGFINARYR